MSQRARIDSTRSGFTLLEAMIALAIIGIAFVGLLASMNRSLLIIDESRFLVEASVFARDEMEKALLDPLPERLGVELDIDRPDESRFKASYFVEPAAFEGVYMARLTLYRSEDIEAKDKEPLITIVTYRGER